MVGGGGWGGRGRVPELGFRWLKLWIERMGGVPQKGQPRQRLRGGDEWTYVLRATVPPTSPRGLPCPNSARSHVEGACPTPAGTQASSQYELRFGLACSWVPVRFHMAVLPPLLPGPLFNPSSQRTSACGWLKQPTPKPVSCPKPPETQMLPDACYPSQCLNRQATSSWVFLAWE